MEPLTVATAPGCLPAGTWMDPLTLVDSSPSFDAPQAESVSIIARLKTNRGTPNRAAGLGSRLLKIGCLECIPSLTAAPLGVFCRYCSIRRRDRAYTGITSARGDNGYAHHSRKLRAGFGDSPDSLPVLGRAADHGRDDSSPRCLFVVHRAPDQQGAGGYRNGWAASDTLHSAAVRLGSGRRTAARRQEALRQSDDRTRIRGRQNPRARYRQNAAERSGR